jgi:hypothetical protein
MDRRRVALGLLLLFIACIGVAVVVSGSRSGPGQGIAPTVAAFAGYLCALAAAVLLIVRAAGHPDGTRSIGFTVLGALVILVLADLYAAEGPNIGAGLVQLVGEVVILVATVRLALGVARAGRTG